MPMAKVYYVDGSHKQVKNLGWLLKHWRMAKSVTVSDAVAHNAMYNTSYDCFLTVYFHTNVQRIYAYECAWASRNVLKEWIHRPVFRGLPMNWFGKRTKC